MVSSRGSKAKPSPCDDFLPTRVIGNSSSCPKGPLRSAEVGMLNSLKF
jgi:hypothetical protein